VLQSLDGVDPLSISVEYLSWKKKYFMMIKYAIKNKDGQVEQHLKILNFNHNFNIKTYMEKKREKERLSKPKNEDAKEEVEDEEENNIQAHKSKMGKVVFET
jgi:hypothetical protein